MSPTCMWATCSIWSKVMQLCKYKHMSFALIQVQSTSNASPTPWVMQIHFHKQSVPTPQTMQIQFQWRFQLNECWSKSIIVCHRECSLLSLRHLASCVIKFLCIKRGVLSHLILCWAQRIKHKSTMVVNPEVKVGIGQFASISYLHCRLWRSLSVSLVLCYSCQKQTMVVRWNLLQPEDRVRLKVIERILCLGVSYPQVWYLTVYFCQCLQRVQVRWIQWIFNSPSLFSLERRLL